MSGRTIRSRSKRMASASGVVGPLAPSAMSFAETRSALSRVMTFSRAAGTRTSTSSSRSSSLVMEVEPLNSMTDPVTRLCS